MLAPRHCCGVRRYYDRCSAWLYGVGDQTIYMREARGSSVMAYLICEKAGYRQVIRDDTCRVISGSVGPLDGSPSSCHNARTRRRLPPAAPHGCRCCLQSKVLTLEEFH